MEFVPKYTALFSILSFLFFMFNPSEAHGETKINSVSITQWQIKWEDNNDKVLPSSERWINSNIDSSAPEKPKDTESLWVKVVLPSMHWNRTAVYFEKVYAQHLTIYMGNKKLYDSERGYGNDIHRVLIPLDSRDTHKELYLKIQTTSDRIGLQSVIRMGDYNELLPMFVSRDLGDIILGSGFLFIALIMFVCSIFLKKTQMAGWNALNVIILSLGLIIITYSPFVSTFYGEYGNVLISLFDLSLFILLPALTIFFEKIFGEGPYSIISKSRKLLVGFSIMCTLFLIVNHLTDLQYSNAYYFVSVTLLGIVFILQLFVIVGLSVMYAIQGNKDALILSIGFAVFGLIVIIEMIWFYIRAGHYDFFLFKWGIVCFIVTPIIILGRNFARDHDRVVKYTRELELYNNEIQRSEKMEMISGLAASVAHEVRNPLQVTRGFLQLLSNRTDDKERDYLLLAVAELDRASHIITDFLTFAKPQLEDIKVLHLSEEIKHIVGVLKPLANLQGGEIIVDIPNNLYILGNSSKFKQALINMIKNSIEALDGPGQVHVWAYMSVDRVFIHIKDNGEGMEPEVLSRLGQPYFSNKTKGTGLGLMVTFRIIEVMEGNIKFKSKKGEGTEAIISFPLVYGNKN
ncbi:HAMP domain-containing sensor histidine kinase [Paenibacillus sediminis]|uniref:histidine kinase n=1 Tax=Paenibacillus sediminis TaxID=664909 RepID=A0ABS4H4F1_9BACL|nr:HAMP domain-containing sensor histidine kinase [Paenibacillus sediminis]MBP1937346.1 signal transduction histidine kinase [Paenibacillus sediminis]